MDSFAPPYLFLVVVLLGDRFGEILSMSSLLLLGLLPFLASFGSVAIKRMDFVVATKGKVGF